MPAPSTFDYAVLRVVPRVERGEFVNAGVVLFCRVRRVLDARVELDEARLLALDPAVDLELVRRSLAGFVRVARGEADGGPIARLPLHERFHWLTAPRSTIVQPSPIHSGECDDPGAELEQLMDEMVRPIRREAPGPGFDAEAQ
ncbi:MAG: DUF3037 domain-containing protein [Hyphomicrobiales bacterium]